MRAILIETPAYLLWRRHLGRRPFDMELPVEHPADAAEVRRALKERGLTVTLLLAGFERYVTSAYALAAEWEHASRYRWEHGPFDPLDKWGQRHALARRCPEVRQPRHSSFLMGALDAAEATSRVGFPLVIKPSNGGGGLGIFLVENAAQRDKALTQLRSMSNYDGSPFERVLLEEYVEGREHSVQGLAWENRAHILTVCEKLITREPVPGVPELRGFREAGHIATHGARISPALRAVAQACLDATGYREGPFHVDVIQNARGAYFVEMGFRLSGGGLVALAEKATGMNWAELVFEMHLSGRAPVMAPTREGPGAYVGQVTCTSGEELAAGERLKREGVQAEVARIAPPQLAEGATVPGEETLASDKLRHAGFAGRITVRGSTLEEVRHHLQSCIAARLGA